LCRERGDRTARLFVRLVQAAGAWHSSFNILGIPVSDGNNRNGGSSGKRAEGNQARKKSYGPAQQPRRIFSWSSVFLYRYFAPHCTFLHCTALTSIPTALLAGA